MEIYSNVIEEGPIFNDKIDKPEDSRLENLISASNDAIKKIESEGGFFTILNNKETIIPPGFERVNTGNNHTVVYDPEKLEIESISRFQIINNEYNFSINKFKETVRFLNVDITNISEMPEKVYYLRPRINQLNYSKVEGVNITVIKNGSGYYCEQLIIDDLVFNVHIHSNLFKDDSDGFTIEVLDMNRATTNSDEEDTNINWSGRNPQIAKNNLMSQIKKVMEQIKLLGFRYVITEPTDERRYRIYKKMGMRDIDPIEYNKQLILDLNDVS